MRPPHHRRPPSSISSASFHSFASSSSTVDRLPAYSPTECDDGAAYRRQYPTITTVRIRDEEDDEPLSATLRRLGAKRKTAILTRKVELEDDEWEDVDEPTGAHPPSRASLRQPTHNTSSRSALSNLGKPLPTAPPATVTACHSTPVPDGWGGRLTRPSWFPSHQPGPLLKTPVPQSSLLKDPRLASLLQPLPGAGKGGEAPIKNVRFASLLPTWRSQPQASGAAVKETGGAQEEKAAYVGGYSAEQDFSHDPLPQYQRDPSWPNHEDAEYPSSSHPFTPRARGINSSRTLLIRTALAIIALVLLLGLAIVLSSHSHPHAHSHSRPSTSSATTASRIKPDVATTESTVQSAINTNGLPSWTSTPTQGAPPLLVSSSSSSSSPAAGKTSASTTAAASSTTSPQAAPATPAASSTATNVIAGSHHAALVSQAVAQAVGQSQA